MSRSTPRRLVLAALLVTALGVAATISPAVASTSAGQSHRVAGKAKKKKPTVTVATTPLGKIIVTSTGVTLYAFQPNGTDTSASKCTAGCATVWPAFTTKSAKPVAGKGLKQSLLTVGGAGQVAYAGQLLHTFSGDSAAGQTSGQGIANLWHVVGADGTAIM